MILSFPSALWESEQIYAMLFLWFALEEISLIQCFSPEAEADGKCYNGSIIHVVISFIFSDTLDKVTPI